MSATVASVDAAARLQELLAWAATVVGPCEVASGDTRFHGRSTVLKVRTATGYAYLKTHVERDAWENEVYTTGHWAPTFGSRAPHLLAIHDTAPLAFLLSEVPGTLMKDATLTPAQQRAAWRAAGEALAALHALGSGTHLGPNRRDGAPAATPPVTAAAVYVLDDLMAWTVGAREAFFSDEEQRLIAMAQGMVADVFADESAIPCHRDYNPYNWLVDEHGCWAGVIDFEFARWDVRVAEFSRYPGWEWLLHPELLMALFEGYGRTLTAREEQQLLIGHVQYATSAISWGNEHDFMGFASEGHTALAHLVQQLL